MAKDKKKENLTPEERLQAALVPDWEQPYKVPENWRWVTLDSTTSIIMGQSPSGANTTDDSQYTPLIGGAADMGDLYPKVTRYTKVPTKLSTNQDLILCIRATLGKPVYSDKEYCLGRGVAAIRPHIGNRSFYKYFFNAFEQYLYDNATGTTFAQVSSQILQQMPLPLPPLPEQQRIVDRIESLFAKLDEAKQKTQDALDSFETRKAAILHKAFTGELTAQWRKEHGVGMEQWKQICFDNSFIKMQNGLAKRSGSSGVPYSVLRLANLSDAGISTEDMRTILLDTKEQENYGLKKNDVLMIRVNGSKENVGKQFLLTTDNQWAFCDHIIRIKYKENLLPAYMVYFSKSDTYKLYVENHMVSSAGQNTISRKGMASLSIPVPDLREQTEIVHILDDLLAKEQQAKDAAETVLEQIDLIKKSILARAFRGELDTNDPAEESAVELVKEVI